MNSQVYTTKTTQAPCQLQRWELQLVWSVEQLDHKLNVHMAEYSTNTCIFNIIFREIQHVTECDNIDPFNYKYCLFLPFQWTGTMRNEVSCSRVHVPGNWTCDITITIWIFKPLRHTPQEGLWKDIFDQHILTQHQAVCFSFKNAFLQFLLATF